MVNILNLNQKLTLYHCMKILLLDLKCIFSNKIEIGSSNAFSNCLIRVWMTLFGCNFSSWYLLANLFNNWWTIFNWYIIWYLNFYLSTNLLRVRMACLVGDGFEGWNTFQVWYLCAMGDFNVTRHFDRDFVALSFNLDLAVWSTSKNWKRLITLSISRFISWIGSTFVTICGMNWPSNHWMTHYSWPLVTPSYDLALLTYLNLLEMNQSSYVSV